MGTAPQQHFWTVKNTYIAMQVQCVSRCMGLGFKESPHGPRPASKRKYDIGYTAGLYAYPTSTQPKPNTYGYPAAQPIYPPPHDDDTDMSSPPTCLTLPCASDPRQLTWCRLS